MDSFHRHILDHQSTATVLVDDDLRVRYLNEAAEYLLASSNSHSLGDPLDSILRNGDSFAADLLASLRDKQSWTKRHATLLAPLSGQELQVDLTVTPMQRCDFEGLVLELRPLDRLLRITREAAQLQVQQTTRQLVRGMAHEVKNPLGGIRGAAQLLERELDAEALKDYTGVIIDEVDRLRDLVDRMLGPNHAPVLAEANIHRILERVRTLLEAEEPERVHFERDYDPSVPDLECDFDQLVQAFLNITRNAQQALDDTPAARITIRTRAVRKFTIGHEMHRLVLRVDIVDNGPGIPGDMLDALFFPMISGRPGGNGLGLSISHAIISQHGGLIECESEPGCTRFTVLLPFTRREPDANQSGAH